MEDVPEGWYCDPYEAHEARWYSEGVATALVRDGRIEGNDPPPESTCSCPLVRVASPGSPGDLRRADEAHQQRPEDRRSSNQTAMDTVCVYHSMA
jgi:hypothetical protein